MKANRYLKPGDLVPPGEPKRHTRTDDGRLILYWDLGAERAFLQAYDSLGNYRIVDGVVQAPKKVFTCAVCRRERSPAQVCPACTALYSKGTRKRSVRSFNSSGTDKLNNSASGTDRLDKDAEQAEEPIFPLWVLELIRLQDRPIVNGYQVQSLDGPLSNFVRSGLEFEQDLPELLQSEALRTALEMVEAAQREAEKTSSFCSGTTASDYRRIEFTAQPRKFPRWNGYRNT